MKLLFLTFVCRSPKANCTYFISRHFNFNGTSLYLELEGMHTCYLKSIAVAVGERKRKKERGGRERDLVSFLRLFACFWRYHAPAQVMALMY